jgi:hypothetical protein
MSTPRTLISLILVVVFFSVLPPSPVGAQSSPRLVGLGDSLGEGVQSADANTATQPWSFLNIIAWRMGASFPLPLIRTNPFGVVGSVSGRSRVDPTIRSFNLAVSGADVHAVLHDAATAASTAQIDSETELVLFPRIGSQIEVAEQLVPQYVVCWIGNNDALDAALDFNHLDATQLTPVASFTADFTQLVERLDAMGTRAVFGTIPDLTSIGYLLSRQEVVRLLGNDHGLPAGNLTTVSAVVMVRLGLASPAVFTDPDYSLDPTELATIARHIDLLNDVIRSTVAAHDMALVDTHAIFDYLSKNTLTLWGAPLTTRFMGGWFSLDGVHPSNIGNTVAAIYFIDALNRRYGAGIPQIDANTLFLVTNTDPFIDKDRDGRVTGRRSAGLLETMLALLGLSGDTNDGSLSPLAPSGVAPTVAPTASPVETTAAEVTTALDTYASLTGRDLRKMSAHDRVEAIRRLFAGRTPGVR